MTEKLENLKNVYVTYKHRRKAAMIEKLFHKAKIPWVSSGMTPWIQEGSVRNTLEDWEAIGTDFSSNFIYINNEEVFVGDGSKKITLRQLKQYVESL